MDLTPSDEQVLLRDMATRFIADEYDYETRRIFMQTPQGYSPGIWKKFAELGWLSLPISEECGGLGGSEVDQGIVMEEIGRGLVIEPYVSTAVLGAGLIEELANEAQKALLLPQIADGALRLAFAHSEPESRYDLKWVHTTARSEGGKYLLSGRKDIVLDAPSADLLLVSARLEDGRLAVFMVPADAIGLQRDDFPTLQGTRASNLTFANFALPADARLGDGVDAAAGVANAVERTIIALCWEAVGCMRAMVDATVEYTKTRMQFGKPLSANQVLRHRMVEMAICVEEAKASALRASLTNRHDAGLRTRMVASAKNKVGRAGRFVGEQAVQLHGGMGVTDELSIGAYFKKLLALETMFGSPEYHLQQHVLLNDVA